MANESYHSGEYYKQMRNMLINGDPRASVCFCIDVSQSMNEYWIEPGGLRRHTGSGFDDGHSVNYFNLNDIRPGYKYYKKIDKLNEVLKGLLTELKTDPDIRSKTAVSIVVYSRYGRVVTDFLDCELLDLKMAECKIDAPETAMGDGLRTALIQIDSMEADYRMVGKDTYTPLLVFMTDGTPTDDPRKEFEEVRKRIEEGTLCVFPLGISESADMDMLSKLFPFKGIPAGFHSRYRMVNPQDYVSIFQEIKENVRERGRVIASEATSFQSAPAVDSEYVDNTQMGETPDYEAYIFENL